MIAILEYGWNDFYVYGDFVNDFTDPYFLLVLKNEYKVTESLTVLPKVLSRTSRFVKLRFTARETGGSCINGSVNLKLVGNYSYDIYNKPTQDCTIAGTLLESGNSQFRGRNVFTTTSFQEENTVSTYGTLKALTWNTAIFGDFSLYTHFLAVFTSEYSRESYPVIPSTTIESEKNVLFTFDFVAFPGNYSYEIFGCYEETLIPTSCVSLQKGNVLLNDPVPEGNFTFEEENSLKTFDIAEKIATEWQNVVYGNFQDPYDYYLVEFISEYDYENIVSRPLILNATGRFLSIKVENLQIMPGNYGYVIYGTDINTLDVALATEIQRGNVSFKNLEFPTTYVYDLPDNDTVYVYDEDLMTRRLIWGLAHEILGNLHTQWNVAEG